MPSPYLFHRISDAASLRAEEAREPAAHVDHLRDALRASMDLMSPRQLRNLEEVPVVRDLLLATALD